MTKYFYSPETGRYYKHAYAAVVEMVLAPARVMEAITLYPDIEWSMLVDPKWCTNHENTVCEILGLFKTITKSPWEWKLRKALYDLVTHHPPQH